VEQEELIHREEGLKNTRTLPGKKQSYKNLFCDYGAKCPHTPVTIRAAAPMGAFRGGFTDGTNHAGHRFEAPGASAV
jgi:hypothetical protein